MGFFNNKKNNNNGYTDLSGMNLQQQSYNQDPYYNSWNDSSADFTSNPYSQQMMHNYSNSSSLSLSDFSRKVYLQMFIGLAITFGIGLYAVLNPDATLNLLSDHIDMFFILCAIEVLLVFILGFFMEKMTPAAATVIFYVYSIINGITIAPTLVIFEIGSVFWVLAATAGVFGAMSLIGKVAKIDVSKWGSILLFGLIGLIIYSVIAMIFRIPMSDLIIGVIGLVLFMGFTIYDTKKIKYFYSASSFDQQRQSKYAIVAALQLYLDFINLFLYILRLFASRRD